MRTYEIPRNYKGEGRILYIFFNKGFDIYMCWGWNWINILCYV